MSAGTDVRGRAFARATIAGLVALLALAVLWETVLAPVRAQGGWLAFKALPLALLAPGVMRGDVKARQWLVLLLPFYAAEGIVRAWSESGRHALVAATAALLAIATFASALAWFRARRPHARA
ncbi:MAG: DUF2069 domain-containing protein [Betaproteobacteria bacterium]